jgi:hypothetical protein
MAEQRTFNPSSLSAVLTCEDARQPGTLCDKSDALILRRLQACSLEQAHRTKDHTTSAGCGRLGLPEYNVEVIQLLVYTEPVIVDWPEEFDRWLTNVEKQGGRLLATTVAMLQALTDLPTKPTEESATFKKVRQARRHELWRVAHPFDPDFAVRLICWFPSEQSVVIALVGFNKKTIGDVFYASAAVRGEALVDAWLRQKGDHSDE